MNAVIDSIGHLAGFLFVVMVLSILWIIVASLGSVFSKMDQKKAAAKKASAPVATASKSVVANPNDVEDEDLVIIASTVAMLLGQKRHRLIAIKPSSTTWSHEGRREHVMSHKLN